MSGKCNVQHIEYGHNIITLYNDRWLTYHGDHFIWYINVELLCCIPEANIILYANCNLKNKNYILKNVSSILSLSKTLEHKSSNCTSFKSLMIQPNIHTLLK